jgi:aminoglycoside 6'-N-acetyltransferase
VDARPTLVGERVILRPPREADVGPLRAILAEPSVARWWGQPPAREELAATLRADDEVVLVVEVAGEVAGAIQYWEEPDPMYRHAALDLYLGGRFQGRGLGPEAVRLLAAFLVDGRGHHRLTIDPAAANRHAIEAYRRVGFRPVGVMRRYERGPDGTYHDGLLMDLLREQLVRAP